jgi:hypothetical protein
MRRYHLPEFFRDIEQEIIADELAEWFPPYSNTNLTFEDCKLKFLSGNLDYRSFQNMINHAYRKPGYFNPAFQKVREFAEYIRPITESFGPLGRCTIWNIPPGEVIKPHRDAYVYHKFITRWIYIVKQDTEKTKLIVSREPLITVPGDMFELLPATQTHAFYNNSDEPWYFLGIDFWNISTLDSVPLDPNNDELQYLTNH